MTTLLDEVRAEVVGAFKAIHDVYYPTTLVNYPDFDEVDIEKQKEPFVSLELDLVKITQAALGESELIVPGFLNVYYYYRPGRGMSGATQYTDMLNQYLCMSQINAIRYEVAVPIPVTTFEGWKGFMNAIKFNVVEAVNC